MELVKYLFSLPVDIKCFLSEHLDEDPLEKFLVASSNEDNPNVKEFVKNTQALCVINSTCADVFKGNCRGISLNLWILKSRDERL